MNEVPCCSSRVLPVISPVCEKRIKQESNPYFALGDTHSTESRDYHQVHRLRTGKHPRSTGNRRCALQSCLSHHRTQELVWPGERGRYLDPVHRYFRSDVRHVCCICVWPRNNRSSSRGERIRRTRAAVPSAHKAACQS